MSRLVTIAIVAFWLVMTGLLVQTVYFPSESRFAEADPQYVIALFLRNSNVSELVVYKDIEPVGEIDLTPARIRIRDKEAGTEVQGYALRFSASGEVELPGLPRQMLRWSGEFRLDDRWNLQSLELAVRFSEPDNVKVELTVRPKTAEFDYKVYRDGVEVPVDLDQKAPGKDQMRLLLMAWGVDPRALEDAETAAREQERLSSMSARHGNIEIAGRRFHAYILRLEVLDGSEIKLYFTDDGQLVKVTTFLGYEALSEVVDPNQR